MPYQAYDLEEFQALARLAAEAPEATAVSAHPTLSVCSGRSYAYVEAITQALDITTPVIFESGGGMFDPVAARTFWNPKFTPEVAEQVDAVRTWMTQTLIPDTGLSLDYGKRTQAGLVSPDEDEIVAHMAVVEDFVDAHAPDLRVFPTHVSIDVVHPDITKKEGLTWLTNHLNVLLDETAFIGDTKGDLVALDIVGHSFAPANAQALVREQVDTVTTGAVLAGTLEAYRWCIAHNKNRTAEAQ